MRAGGILVLLALLAPGTVAAQLSGEVALLSDYRFRGESLTEGGPALQAAVNYDHSSGVFLGGLVSNVRIDPDVAGLSAVVYGGYTHPLGKQASWDAGVVTYVFPQPSAGPDYNYTEAFVGATYKTLSTRVYYTSSYFGAGQAVYVELNGTYSLSERISLIAHIGYLGQGQPREPPANGQHRGLIDFLAGLSVDLSGFKLGISVVGTDAQQNACPAGSGRCSTTGVVSISHSF